MIQAKIVADSICNGHRITTMEVTMPRFILAELNTHRMFSRNSASSRAIPTKKMLKSILDNPFIPIAWQKDHSGMQGTEYFEQDQKFNLKFLREYMFKRLKDMYRDSKDQAEEDIIIDQRVLGMYQHMFDEFSTPGAEYTLTEFWLMIRDKIMQAVILLYCLGVTKQLCNRLLEPFMWQTVLITATEWENFFALRCPQYVHSYFPGKTSRSWESLKTALWEQGNVMQDMGFHDEESNLKDYTILQRLQQNKGGAEIHMMATAEVMWDALNESVPQQLKEGEWHLPYIQKNEPRIWTYLYGKLGEGIPQQEFAKEYWETALKVSTARCARTSYTILGEDGEKVPETSKDVDLHDKLTTSGHWSPAEHCARAMTAEEFRHHLSGKFEVNSRYEEFSGQYGGRTVTYIEGQKGWCGNFRGWIQYRKLFKNENITK